MASRTVKIIGLLGILLIAGSIPLPVLMSSSSEDEVPAATAPPAPPPPLVTVGAVEPGPVPLAFEFAGRVGAFRDVEIRARVSGVLLERAFEEGAPVKQGDVLFRIDPAPYEAELARAQAQLQQAQARLNQAERQADRVTTLFERETASAAQRDEAVSAVELARAEIAAAEAQVKTAEINLGYTTVTAPIAGISSLEEVPEGSLVGTTPDNSLLTRISQLDPAHVSFSFTDALAADVRRLLETGSATGDLEKLEVTVTFGDGSVYPHKGRVDFASSNVDLQTGTINARAVLPNPEQRLLPGQFVRVTVTGITLKDAIAIPADALMQGPQGPFVYVVNAENKAEARPITLDREMEERWIVQSGLKHGDRIVTEGVIKVQPGAPVTIAGADEPTPAPNPPLSDAPSGEAQDAPPEKVRPAALADRRSLQPAQEPARGPPDSLERDPGAEVREGPPLPRQRPQSRIVGKPS